MVAPIFAAIPAIFSVLKSGAELFNIGKKVVEEVKGEPSSATTPQELAEEVDQMSPEQSEKFIERMKTEIEAYEAITTRLTVQGGKMDAETLNAIPVEERGRIAVMRMTTRPWAVRWMVIAVVFPPLAIVCINSGISVYNVLNAAWAQTPNAIELIKMGDIINALYMEMVQWAALVIMAYMGVREIGKARGVKDGVSVSDVAGSVTSFWGGLRGLFK
ncbi:hypothetical protein MTBPR1_60003 [Candidatus Terasakiella magnetica]|uniref:Uncharacterized protein n=2 Tax=Candidatus Terasakiella magnetica TaxID=1867952 RepID=A0A1C3RJM4_9PROT|nr:hypothetical protein MTBPR1_60003 [Candidatus Terasakiella magnetica]